MRLGDLIALRRSRISLSLGVVSRPAHAGGGWLVRGEGLFDIVIWKGDAGGFAGLAGVWAGILSSGFRRLKRPIELWTRFSIDQAIAWARSTFFGRKWLEDVGENLRV